MARFPDSTGMRLSDDAYSRLRDLIMSGAIPPQALIREGEIAKELGMSRTPVREALRRLQAEGLVTALPHKGYLVVELSEEELENVYRVRDVLEGLAAELAARHARRTDLAQMEELYDLMVGAKEAGRDDLLAELNRQLHAAIAAASGNAYLEATLADISDIIQRFRPTALNQERRREDAHREHRELIDAISRGEAESAAGLAREHVRAALKLRVKTREERQTLAADEPTDRRGRPGRRPVSEARIGE